MTFTAQDALDQYIRGEITLAATESALKAAAHANGDLAASIVPQLDELLRAGRLPVQVHGILKRAAAGGAPPESDARLPAGDGDAVERTNVAVPRASESGYSEPGTATQRPAAPDKTQRPAAPEATPRAATADATRLDPRRAEPTLVAAPSARGAPDAGDGALGTAPQSRAPTGSNWAHPEEWHLRHEGPLGPGSIVKDRFVLENELGHGGMGIVFRALDRRKQEAQDRDPYVAIKILNEEFRRHPSSLIALQREARKAQQLAHPNVITVYDFDRDGTTVFMTMELLDGEPLSRLISTHKLGGVPPERALPLVQGMGDALAYAHKKGIVHSDFKPGNVFVTRDGEVKVLDFGIARAVPSTLRPDADRTVFDASELGALTPPYASPEMLAGSAPVPADDVFALAIVAVELLTGRHPFDRMPASTARERGVQPVPLPAGLSRRQRRALARALEFERDRRHASATAFLADFQGPGPIKKAAYATAGVALLVAAGAVWYGQQLRPDVPWESLSDSDQQRFNYAVNEGRTALGVGAPPEEALAFFDQAYTIHRNNPRAIEGLEDVADRLLAALRTADARDQRRALQALNCQEHLANYRPVRAACEDLLGSSCSDARLPPC